MSEASAPRLGFPELPKLDPRDLEIMKASFPGKLLGRMAALMALAVLALGFAGALDLGLRQFLDVDLKKDAPRLRLLILFGLPALVVLAQIIGEWRTARLTAKQKRLAVTPAEVPRGYFRIGPYADTPEDRAAF
jgi:hypothetical protein